MLNERGGPINMAYPIKAGEVVVFEVTGLGSTTPEVPDGMPAPGNLVGAPNVAPVILFSDHRSKCVYDSRAVRDLSRDCADALGVSGERSMGQRKDQVG